jgi:hypothetical protein
MLDGVVEMSRKAVLDEERCEIEDEEEELSALEGRKDINYRSLALPLHFLTFSNCGESHMM